MSDTAAILKQAHAELWTFRAEMGDTWPTPPTKDALPFAITEAGEALDAWMRASYPQYARNRDRLNGEEAVLDELADTAMMLLTALGVSESMWDFWDDWNFLPSNIFNIVWAVVEAHKRHARGFQGWVDDVQDCVGSIAIYPGMDLLTRLRSRYARIRAKQRPVRLAEIDGQIGGWVTGTAGPCSGLGGCDCPATD